MKSKYDSDCFHPGIYIDHEKEDWNFYTSIVMFAMTYGFECNSYTTEDELKKIVNEAISYLNSLECRDDHWWHMEDAGLFLNREYHGN